LGRIWETKGPEIPVRVWVAVEPEEWERTENCIGGGGRLRSVRLGRRRDQPWSRGLVRICGGMRRNLRDRDEIQGFGGAPWAAGFTDWVSGPVILPYVFY
jgi:hypothetical protein